MPPTLMYEYIVQPIGGGDEQTLVAKTPLEAARYALPDLPPEQRAALSCRPGADGLSVVAGNGSGAPLAIVWRAWRVAPAGDHAYPEPGYYASREGAAREAERLSRARGHAYEAVRCVRQGADA